MKYLILIAVTLIALTTEARAEHRQNFENYLQGRAVHQATELQLGRDYKSGRGGVHQNYASAAWMFRRAAERGDGPAQVELGLLYEKGLGVDQNNMVAHMWYNLAATKAWFNSAAMRENAKSNRDRIAQKMTPAEIAEAERYARMWKGDPDWGR